MWRTFLRNYAGQTGIDQLFAVPTAKIGLRHRYERRRLTLPLLSDSATVRIGVRIFVVCGHPTQTLRLYPIRREPNQCRQR